MTTLTSSGVLGADVSAPTSEDDWKVLLQHYPFQVATVEVYRNSSLEVVYAGATIKAARAAGFQSVEVYHFPTPTTSVPASEQVEAAIKVLDGQTIGTWWLDVEFTAGPCPWADGNPAANEATLTALVDAVRAAGFAPGIYTNQRDWKRFFLDSTQFSEIPLWYCRDDGNPNFDDFAARGPQGWSVPTVKQYGTGRKVGSVSYDASWRPSLPSA
jgi:hypothetical protein